MGLYPVGITIFAAVFNDADPWSTTADICPKVGKGDARHLGVTNDIVWLANEFGLTVATDLDEIGIDVDDAPRKIGARDDDLIIAQFD